MDKVLTGGWWSAAGLGLLAGTAAQLQQATVWPWPVAVALGLLGLLGLVATGGRQAPALWLLTALSGAALGLGATDGRAAARLQQRLPATLEGVDLLVHGQVSGLPVWRSDGVRFLIEVDGAWRDGQPVTLPPKLALGWYFGGLAADGERLAPGQRWAFPVRLRRPHGLQNPHGHDHELWLFEQDLGATGYVRTQPAPQRLARSSGAPVDRAREAVRQALARQLGDHPAAGVLAALVVGDQAAIGADDWAVFRVTGVAHLVSISGLHVTMIVWLAGAVVTALWRRAPPLHRVLAAVQAGRWGGLAAGVAYTALAGWGVPAQRTLCMVAVATLWQMLGVRWPWPMVWGAAAVAVTVLDPWALLQPGFWLSFGAVGLLLAAAPPQAPSAGPPAAGARVRAALHGVWRGLRQGVRTQAVASLGLAPLTLLFFHQVSLVGLLANLLAIPLVTLLITPLALAGLLLPALWSLTALGLQAWLESLRAMAAWPMAAWSVPAAPLWAIAAGALGAVWLVLPLPWRVRLLGLPMCLPMLGPPQPLLPAGEFELLAADIGQGNAVLVRTAGHALLYDTGPRYAADSDAGERVLVPLLRAEGVTRLDRLLLSHADNDHVGGAASVLRGVGADLLLSSLPAGHALRAGPVPAQACQAGLAWTWDGVRFELLHPAADEAGPARPNARSCVLRIRARQRQALLAGDIERTQENRLLREQADRLAADWLLVPHHGSRTSSSDAFLDAVRPRVALVQAGYRNRFGHPAAEVLARYRARGITVLRSDRCGAWRWRSDQDPRAGVCERQRRPRYWHTADLSDADPAAAERAVPDPTVDGPELANPWWDSMNDSPGVAAGASPGRQPGDATRAASQPAHQP